MELILASASPRRAALLDAAGIAYRAEPTGADETPEPFERPDNYVSRVALAKAREAARRHPGSLILAADTAVTVGGRILGKPEHAADAAGMLQLLSGRTHEVLTGVTLAHGPRETSDIARTRVRFASLRPAEVEWYIATGEPFGKAGAYAIQGFGSRFVEWIEGSYSNVVGLPVNLVYRLLTAAGWTVAGG